MTPYIYDGKSRAELLKKDIKKKIAIFKKETGITPTLAILKVNRTEGTGLYTRMKVKAAEEVGAKVEIFDVSSPKKNFQDIIRMIRYVDLSPEIHGIMVQLPFPRRLKEKSQYILDFIPEQKDIDGMRSETKYEMPVTKAVIDAVKEYQREVNKKALLNTLVIGAKGFVGKDVVNVLKSKGHVVREVDRSGNRKFTSKSILERSKDLDLIITATGHAGLLNTKNVVDGVGIVDVGAPKPEVDVSSIRDKITYLTPVPGGIGPVTIAYLLENLYEATYNQTR